MCYKSIPYLKRNSLLALPICIYGYNNSKAAYAGGILYVGYYVRIVGAGFLFGVAVYVGNYLGGKALDTVACNFAQTATLSIVVLHGVESRR